MRQPRLTGRVAQSGTDRNMFSASRRNVILTSGRLGFLENRPGQKTVTADPAVVDRTEVIDRALCSPVSFSCPRTRIEQLMSLDRNSSAARSEARARWTKTSQASACLRVSITPKLSCSQIFLCCTGPAIAHDGLWVMWSLTCRFRENLQVGPMTPFWNLRCFPDRNESGITEMRAEQKLLRCFSGSRSLCHGRLSLCSLRLLLSRDRALNGRLQTQTGVSTCEIAS
jgi:hypothetical protein